MDLSAEIKVLKAKREAVEAKRDALEAELLKPSISEAREVAIRGQISGMDRRIAGISTEVAALYGLVGAAGDRRLREESCAGSVRIQLRRRILARASIHDD